MQFFNLPCGKNEISLSVPDDIETKVIKPKDVPVIKDVESAIKRSIFNPIGTKRITQIVKPKDKVVIIVTDSTRKLPEDIIVPILLDELERAGVNMNQVTVINALGKHKPDTVAELTQMLGTKVMNRVKVLNHDCENPNKLKNLGKTKNGIPVVINDIVANADVRITTGTIEPHLFAGYSGGVKTLSVGVAGIETLAATHNVDMLEHPRTRLGIIEKNIFREFLTEVAMTVGIDFIVNVVQDGHKELLGIFAGDPVKVFKEGVKKARKVYETKIDREYDIVISIPSYPKSSDLYQATRAWNTVIFGPRPIIKKGGTIIIPAPCEKGFGHSSFYEWLAKASFPEEVINRAHKFGFEPGDQKALIAAKVLEYASVYITNCLIPKEKIKNMHFKAEDNLQEAVDKVIAKRNNPSILIMPYGLITLPLFG